MYVICALHLHIEVEEINFIIYNYQALKDAHIPTFDGALMLRASPFLVIFFNGVTAARWGRKLSPIKNI